MSERQGDEKVSDRRHYGPREYVILATLILNFGGLVWGAATLAASVTELRESVNMLNRTSVKVLEDLSQLKIEYNARLSVMEDRMRRSR